MKFCINIPLVSILKVNASKLNYENDNHLGPSNSQENNRGDSVRLQISKIKRTLEMYATTCEHTLDALVEDRKSWFICIWRRIGLL